MRAPSQIFACPNLSILSTQRPPHPDGTGCSLAFPSGGSVLAVLGKLCSQPLQCHSSWPARLDAGPLCPTLSPTSLLQSPTSLSYPGLPALAVPLTGLLQAPGSHLYTLSPSAGPGCLSNSLAEGKVGAFNTQMPSVLL